LEAFGFASLRDLPDLERLKAEGLLHTGQREDELDSALGFADEDDAGPYWRQRLNRPSARASSCDPQVSCGEGYSDRLHEPHSRHPLDGNS
jgi:hypothetical protein